jgi:hypothetical protein
MLGQMPAVLVLCLFSVHPKNVRREVRHDGLARAAAIID